MGISKKWNYDYDSRCECSDDDNCGCTYPENMARSYVAEDIIKSPAVSCNYVKVGEQAVNFNAPAIFADNATTSEFNFFDYISDSYALLMFYMADFSAICPKELTAFSGINEKFASRGVKIVAVSVDSLAAHQAWRKLPYSEGGVGQVLFPLVSDLNKAISLSYGVLRSDGMAQRATFLIDKSLKIRYQATYDRNIERNTDETLRVVDCLQTLDKAECRGLDCLMHKKSGNETFTQY